MQEIQTIVPWSFTKEKDFTTAWLKTLKGKWHFVYKLTDASMWKKPYDAIIRSQISTYHTELKIVEWNIFKISDLRNNQYSSLRNISELWWNAIVVVYSVKFNDYKIIDFNKILKCSINDSIKLVF